MKSLPWLSLGFLVARLPVSAAGILAALSPDLPVIPPAHFSVEAFGAKGDASADATPAFRAAIAAVAKAGGGSIEVPPGTYLCGPIELCSALDLHLDRGARILFTQDKAVYPATKKGFGPMVRADGCHDVQISGEGILDGQGEPWWAAERVVKAAARARGLNDGEVGRPKMIVLEGCTRVLVEGVTLTRSPMFHLVPSHCTDVTVRRVSILSPADSPNTDGIDPSASRRVLIDHCTIDTGDDNIAVKGGPGVCEDILVTDCTFLHGHGCSIGSDTNAGVHRMLVRRCTFENTVAGVRLKSSRGRGGLVEDITYEDLSLKAVADPIVITSYYYGLPKPGKHDVAHPAGPGTPEWRNIHIRNLVAEGGTKDGGLIMGLPEQPAHEISLENIRISAPVGLRIGYARNVSLVDVRVDARSGPALVVEDTVDGLYKSMRGDTGPTPGH